MNNYSSSIRPLIISVTICLLFISTEFFGWRKISFLSIRHVSLFIVPIVLLYYRFKILWKESRLFMLLLSYYVFVSILGLFNGLYEDVGVTLVLGRFLPSIIIFYYIISAVRDNTTFHYTICGLIGIAVIDAFVTILQGLGNPIGWAIGLFFMNPDSTDVVDTEMLSLGKSITYGMIGTVVANGFYLASYGLLFCYPLIHKRNLKGIIMSSVLCVIFFLALYYNQQRAAFYVYSLLSVFIIFYLVINSKKSLVLILAVVILFVFLLFISNGLFDNVEFGRLENVGSDAFDSRHERHQWFYSSFLPDHLLFGDRTEYVNRYGQTPHNMLIETFLLGGLFGVVIFLYFVFSYLLYEYRLFVNRRYNQLMMSLPIVAVFFISWEHSNGIHTGLSQSIFLFAIFEVFLKFNSPAKKYKIRH